MARREVEEFGLERVAVFTLSAKGGASTAGRVDFPKEGKVVCAINNQSTAIPAEPGTDPEALLVRAAQYQGFRYDTPAGKILPHVRDSGDRYSRVMSLRKGRHNALQVRVDEVREAFISGTGSADVTF